MNDFDENEILDHDFKKSNNFYSKRSFKVFLLILLLVAVRIFLTFYFSYTFAAGALFHFISTMINIAIRVLSIYGVYVAIVSVTQREPISAFKIIGLIGNILAFVNLIFFLFLAF